MNGRNFLVVVFVTVVLIWLSSAAFGVAVPPMMAFTGGTTGSLILIMILAIPLVAIIGGLFIEALKILKGDGSGPGGLGDLSEDEGQTIQEINRGLNRMEKRIEALETILLERTSGAREREEPYREETKDAK